MFKNLYISLLFLLMPSLCWAQFTKGGSTKNYEEYHFTVDTVRTPIKVKDKQGYFYFCSGPTVPLSQSFARSPSSFSSISDSYNRRDGMGGRAGLAFAIGGFYSFKSLNRKIHPVINIGLGQNHAFVMHFYDWSDLDGFGSGEFLASEGYTPFYSFSHSLAPMISLNPAWKKRNKIHFDFSYKLGGALVVGGGQDHLVDGLLIERDNYMVPHFVHGPSIRFRGNIFFLNLDFTFLTESTEDAFEVTLINGTSRSTTSMNSNVNLSYFTINLGFNF